MNESTRTLSFVGVAVVLAAVAFGTHIATRPPTLADFDDVGEEFYPDFKDPRTASGLRVAAYNEEAARVDVFNVESRDGRWTIPSHHNYPADGEERLANTATSIIGLSREALASTSADDHKRLGVLDPLDETVAGTEGRGDRITLTRGDDVLVDYIVGTKIEDGPENTFHVRKADEARTYRATLDLDISTKFADWIEPDLLDFRRGDIRELVVDRYSVDETTGGIVPGDQSILTRSTLDDPWKLDGLDEATEEVNTSTVNQMINALEDLTIVGVRPKPEGLSASLKGEAGGGIGGLTIADLQQKGFFIDQRNGTLVSNEGDVRLGTSDGVMYVLRFGEVFTGSDVEIEVGSSGDTEEQTDAEESTSDEAAAADPDDADGAESGSGRRRHRSKEVATCLLRPNSPSRTSTHSMRNRRSRNRRKARRRSPKATTHPTRRNRVTKRTRTPPKGTTTRTITAEGEEEKPDPQAEYKKALEEYETKLKDWEQKETERKEKIKEGEERVKELNARFADWYYVISADAFDDIRVSRDDLVEMKEPETTEEADAGPSAETIAPPVLTPPAQPETKEDAPADTPEPAADAKRDAEPANETPQAPPGSPATDKPEETPEKESPADEPSAGEKSEPDDPPESN